MDIASYPAIMANKWRDIVFKRRCCECGRRDGLLIQWVDKPAQYICPGCAWEHGYPEFCYETCSIR